MDSIRPEVRSFYLERGVKVVDESHDQDSTDLEKCLRHIEDRPTTNEAAQPTILAIGALPLPSSATYCALLMPDN